MLSTGKEPLQLCKWRVGAPATTNVGAGALWTEILPAGSSRKRSVSFKEAL